MVKRTYDYGAQKNRVTKRKYNFPVVVLKKQALRIFSVALLALLVTGSADWALAAEAKKQPEPLFTYEVPAGALEQALQAYANQTGLKLTYDSQLVRGKSSVGVYGSYTASKALGKLLEGTGLHAVVQGPGKIELGKGAGPGDESPVVKLPETSVRAAGVADPESHSISAETLRRTLARDIADIFSTDSSVTVGGGGRFTQRLYLRGVESNSLNISIDGASQGRSLHQHMGDAGLVDPELLKKVEVQTGPRADAGPGALGGSIVFETADARDLLLEGRKMGATISGGYGSVDESWKGGATAYGVAGEHFGILAHISGGDRENYEVGDGGPESPNSNGENHDYLGKISILDLNGHSLRFSAENIKNEGQYLWGYIGSDMGYPTDSSFDSSHVEIERQTYTADYRYEPGNDLINARLNVFYNENKVTNDSWDSENTSEKTGGDLRNTFRFDLGPTTHNLTVGLDFRSETSKGVTMDDGSEKENDSSNIGYFLQNRMRLGALGLTFGARLDDYDADFGTYNFSGNEVSPNLGATYDLIKGLTAFASYGEATRASGVIPGTWLTNISSKTLFSVNEPEQSKQWQGGLRYLGQGLLMADDHLRLSGTYFDTLIENRIEAVGRRGVISEIRNGDDLTSKGFELRAAWGLPSFETSLSYTHVTLEDEDGNPVGVIRRVAGASGDRLVWDNRWQPMDQVTLGYTMNLVFRLTDVPEGEPDRPGYVVHNIQAAYEPSWCPNLTLNLVVDNLFDARYADHTTIYSPWGTMEEPGLDIRLGLTYKF